MLIFRHPTISPGLMPKTFSKETSLLTSLSEQGGLKQCVLGPVVSLLREDKDAHVFIFVKFQSKVWLYASALEEMLSSKLLCEGVLGIDGDMNKVEKFAHTCLSTSSLMMRGHHFCVLVATPAANTGLDKPKTNSVIHYGLLFVLGQLNVF